MPLQNNALPSPPGKPKILFGSSVILFRCVMFLSSTSSHLVPASRPPSSRHTFTVTLLAQVKVKDNGKASSDRVKHQIKSDEHATAVADRAVADIEDVRHEQRREKKKIGKIQKKKKISSPAFGCSSLSTGAHLASVAVGKKSLRIRPNIGSVWTNRIRIQLRLTLTTEGNK